MIFYLVSSFFFSDCRRRAEAVSKARQQNNPISNCQKKNISMTIPPLIQLQQVSFSYPDGRQILDRIDMTIGYNQKIGLIGPNGSGKTTLLHLIMGLHRPTEGRLLFKDNEITDKDGFRQLRRNIGLVFQDADDQLFSATVLEDVAFGPLNLGKTPEKAIQISVTTLEKLGLGGLKDQVTHRLSGGEKKLVSIATVLSMQPEAILLDEPTNNLDPAIRERLIALLNKLDISCLIISHDWDFLSATCSDLYALDMGRVVRSSTGRLHLHRHAHACGEQPHEHTPEADQTNQSSRDRTARAIS
jgi:cobalt/nickel transport system ATP-binding protein